MVITNVYEWFIIDSNFFDKNIYRNAEIRKLYETKISDKKDNRFFYEEIAKIIGRLDVEIPCAYFDIRDYETVARKENKEDDKNLIALLKILSPYFLLKVPFANDSNALNEKFYKELLYIIGLEEAPEGSKTIIRRREKNKQPGSLIENAINILKTEDSLDKIKDKTVYGQTFDEQIFGIALELGLTWMNRILFLKLLEGLLISYHKNSKEYRFLNPEKVHDFDELYKLFHQVLARNIPDRTPAINQKYSRVPYLNSSLFEISELENLTIKINSLDHSEKIELTANTILREEIKGTGKLPALEYLFRFLDAYDFSTEGGEDIAEDNKTIINASVLGKVFEKINGYKDGSIFTPGFITIYMSRKAIRMAVIQKFNEYFRSVGIADAVTFEDIYNHIDKTGIRKANDLVNSLRICDPAVGSGHFLVSTLNELIAIKSELGILVDQQGKRLRGYEIVVENDELIISDENGIFRYNFQNKESQRVQEAIFQEKQTIIENCLFGVDINSNSVKICRLRLWIELLKSAFYKSPGYTELETLPNIDINIKCGNSLISRYSLDADLKKALQKSNWTMASYRLAVSTYRNARIRDEKREMVKIIEGIKSSFETEIQLNDKRFKKLRDLKGELFTLTNQVALFDKTRKEENDWNKKVDELTVAIKQQENIIEEIRSSKIYKNAFEWRFEFPEVLNDHGDFTGFDLVIGNPPYFSVSTDKRLRALAGKYETYVQTGDVYALFYELGINILKTNGFQCLIVSNKWMRANYGMALRQYILSKSNPLLLVDFGQNLLFANAIVHASIIFAQKCPNQECLSAIRFDDHRFFDFVKVFGAFIEKNKIDDLHFDENPWNVVHNDALAIKRKVELLHLPLKDWEIKFNRGILTGLNEAFIIDGTEKERILMDEPQSAKFIKPILRGRDTRRYYADYKDYWILNIPKGYTIKTKLGIGGVVLEPVPSYGNVKFDEAWDWFSANHPLVAGHLALFKQKAEKREDQGDFWWELRACSYIAEFEKPKIIFSEIVSEPQFYFDEKGYYPEATVFFITGKKLKYITALLNSTPVTYLFKTFYMGGELVGKTRYKKSFLEKVPIPLPSEEQEQKIVGTVDRIIGEKNKNNNTAADENQIDQLVYQLYGLTDEEKNLIEKAK